MGLLRSELIRLGGTGGARHPRAGAAGFLPALLLAGLAAAGCGRPPGAAPAPAQAHGRRLDNLRATPFELAAAVLEALERDDPAALEALRVSQAEFEGRIWPELPASRPERRVPLDYAWGSLDQKSRIYLAQILRRFRGKKLRLLRVEFIGETNRYPTFKVHRDSRVVVVDPQGRLLGVRLFGSILEIDRGYKLVSYVVD